MTKAELLATISSYELSEWIALYLIESEEREQAQQNRDMR